MSETVNRYLPKEEKNRTRALYEANFPEDSVAFVDYYYNYKTEDNCILVMEDAGEPKVMIHLNPYTFKVCGHSVLVNYIVAVATEVSVRRQGKMSAMMERVLCDMAREHQPFTFLIPANPAVYRSSGFAFADSENYMDCAAFDFGGFLSRSAVAADIPALSRSADAADIPALTRSADAADIPAMAHFANTFLGQAYDIFPEHTEAYYRRMMAELVSQNGGIVLLVRAGTGGREIQPVGRDMSERGIHPAGKGMPEREIHPVGKDMSEREIHPAGKEVSGQIIGIFTYGRENGQIKIQEILAKQSFVPFTEQESPLVIDTMNFMFRILDLRALVPLLCSHRPYVLRVQVQDRVLSQNAGAYEIRLDRAGASITDIPAEETECDMDIVELTRYLFGKMKIFVRECV